MKPEPKHENQSRHAARLLPAAAGLLLLLTVPFFTAVLPAHAAENTGSTAQEVIPGNLSTPDGNWTASLTDNDYGTAVGFEADDVLSVYTDTPVSSLYIEWSRVPPAWTLEAGGQTVPCGEHGFLHEYAELPAAVTECRIRMPSGGRIANIRAFSAGTPPQDV